MTTYRDPNSDVTSANDFHELTKMHAEFLEENYCFVVAMGEDTEVFLVPVQSTKNHGSNECVFWAYAAMRGAVAHVTEMVDTGRIPLVFDLDETLVQAHTIFSLRNRGAQLTTEILAQNESNALPDSNEKLRDLREEKEVLDTDVLQLQSFMERDRIELNGQTITASREYVTAEDGQDFLRPVIRLPDKIFTRIDPKRNETSMLIRVRSGWEGLSSYLRGDDTAEKRQRFKIWVCTAAERGYALEAWRLLDPAADLIPTAEIRKRLICAGKQKKSLFRTFNLGPLHDEPFPEKVLFPKKKLGPLSEGHSEMAMAIIADDRIDVWEKRNQDQILKIAPYQYPCIDDRDPKEIQRMLSVFQSVRSRFYFELMEQMAPAIREAWNAGLENAAAVQSLLENLNKAASISPFLTTFVNPPMTTPPERKTMTEASLKPNDRRSIVQIEESKIENTKAVRVPTPPKKRRNSKRNRKQADVLVHPPLARHDFEIDTVLPAPTDTDINATATELELPDSFAADDDMRPSMTSEQSTMDELMEDIDVRNQKTQEGQPSTLELQQTMASLPGFESTCAEPEPSQMIPGIFQMQETSPCFTTGTEAPFGLTVFGVSRPVEAHPVQQIQQTVQMKLPAFFPQNAMEAIPQAAQTPQQFLTFNQLSNVPNGGSAAGQLSLASGKMIIIPRQQAQVVEQQQNRYTIARLSDGQLILQPIPPLHPQREQPAPAPVPNQFQGQSFGYVMQSHPVMNTPPAVQPYEVKPWTTNWNPQQTQITTQTPQPTQQIAGSYSRQLNLPGHVLLSSQAPNLESALQPHQLDVPGMTLLQTASHPQPEQRFPSVLMMPSSQPIEVMPLAREAAATIVDSTPDFVQNVDVEPKLEYANLPVSQPPQLFFQKLSQPPPPTSPPNQQPSVETQVFSQGTQSRPNRGKQKSGFHQRGMGKRQKQMGMPQERQIGHFSPALRQGRRGQPNNRRPSQRKAQNQKTRNAQQQKKQKHAGNKATGQDFNFMGYMAQLEDELEEQDPSEEGEIRE